MNVFDASALLAFLQRERGARTVEDQLVAGGLCSAVNWSEVAQKTTARAAPWNEIAPLLLSFGVRIEPVSQDDAERAAELWVEHPTLSLADRCCLALRERVGAIAWTADTAWADIDGVQLIR